MAENIEILNTGILEKSSARITATVIDDIGSLISYTALDTLTLTLFNVADSSIINSREDQDVLNDNNVSLDAVGNLIWTVQELDNIIVVSNTRIEQHRAVFTWTYAGGTKTGKHIIEMSIVNLEKTI